MRLPGRLSATTLGDVLGTLYRAQTTGSLELVELSGAAAGRSHRLHLDEGLVSGVDTPLRSAPLGEILRSEGFLGDLALRAFLRRLREAPGRRSGELLIELRAITPAVLSAALHEQLRARLDSVFTLNEASVRFHVARSRQRDCVPLSPSEFLHGRPRARDLDARASYLRGAFNAPPRVSPPQAARVRALSTLGLPAGADDLTVRRAFRQLAAAHHPDRFPRANAPEREELMRRFAELSAAYHALV